MDLASKREIVELLEKHQTKPIKGLGQNFLINKEALKKIILLVEPESNVVEIGPGIGTLTKELSKKSKKIIAIEKDKKMVEILKKTLKNFKNIKIVSEDILKISNSQLCLLYRNNFNHKNQPISDYSVISNLPYYIAAAIIRKFLETKKPPKKMVLTIQKELAQRICSSPPKMNILAVSVQFYADCKIIFNISKNSFWPQPKVDSSIIEIIPQNYFYNETFRNNFFNVVKAGFSRPRAQLLNNISKKLKLEKKDVKKKLLKLNIDPKQRAETIKINEWINLTKNLI